MKISSPRPLWGIATRLLLHATTTAGSFQSGRSAFIAGFGVLDLEYSQNTHCLLEGELQNVYQARERKIESEGGVGEEELVDPSVYFFSLAHARGSAGVVGYNSSSPRVPILGRFANPPNSLARRPDFGSNHQQERGATHCRLDRRRVAERVSIEGAILSVL